MWRDFERIITNVSGTCVLSHTNSCGHLCKLIHMYRMFKFSSFFAKNTLLSQ